MVRLSSGHQAYSRYPVAYKQFADNIPLAIDHKPLVRHEENGMGT